MPKDDADYLEYCRTRTKKPPQLLHKYTSTDVARYILSTGKIRFQSPLRYNDPFDSQWDPYWNVLTPEAEVFCRQLLTEAIEDPNSWPKEMDLEFKTALLYERNRIFALPAEKRKSAIQKFVEDASESDDQNEEMKFYMLDFRRRLRVLCLSENSTSVTMWSHYADQHRGVLLTFNTNLLEDGLKRPIKDVLYEDTPPVVIDMEEWYRSIYLGLPQPVINKDSSVWTRTKSPEWKQEQEWRLTTLAQKGTLGDYEDFDIPKISLVEITMGCRTDKVIIKELAALAQPFGGQVKFSQLYMPVGSFSLAKKELLFSDI